MINERVVVGDGKTTPAKTPLSETISSAPRDLTLKVKTKSGSSPLKATRCRIKRKRPLIRRRDRSSPVWSLNGRNNLYRMLHADAR
jgi:hypothetical protein